MKYYLFCIGITNLLFFQVKVVPIRKSFIEQLEVQMFFKREDFVIDENISI